MRNRNSRMISRNGSQLRISVKIELPLGTWTL